MLTKNKVKQIRLLSLKKFRQKHGLFIVEGEKAVSEFYNAKWSFNALYSVEDKEDSRFITIGKSMMSKITQLSTPSPVLGVFKIRKMKKDPFTGFSLAIDSIKDPGNLGNIIRLCDWFGVEHLYCSKGSVDFFNPKTIQSSMGSLTRVNCHFCDLDIFLEKYPNTIYGATLNGEDFNNISMISPGILVLGNESNGISSKIINLLTKQITIPSSSENNHIESINVSSAAAILLSKLNK